MRDLPPQRLCDSAEPAASVRRLPAGLFDVSFHECLAGREVRPCDDCPFRAHRRSCHARLHGMPRGWAIRRNAGSLRQLPPGRSAGRHQPESPGGGLFHGLLAVSRHFHLAQRHFRPQRALGIPAHRRARHRRVRSMPHRQQFRHRAAHLRRLPHDGLQLRPRIRTTRRRAFPTDCSLCHSTINWTGATFDHSKTTFPLTGAHVAAPCAQCHVNNNYTTVADQLRCLPPHGVQPDHQSESRAGQLSR